MTDYDGTLTPHVSDPGEAQLAHEVQRHLAVLARTPSVRLAVVSGRDLGDVTQRVATAHMSEPVCGGDALCDVVKRPLTTAGKLSRCGC